MRRVAVVLFSIAVAVFMLAGSTAATTTIRTKATFAEQFGGPNNPVVCPNPPSSCGAGEVLGLGQANEIILFNECSDNCHLRVLTFANGSTLVLQETFTGFSSPDSGHTFNPQSYGNPYSLTLSDSVRGDLSTGDFAGATGSLTGHVMVAGAIAVVSLSGQITLAG
jgi:hypothetical protein